MDFSISYMCGVFSNSLSIYSWWATRNSCNYMHCCLPRVPPWLIRYMDQTYSVCSTYGTMIPMEARKLETGPLWSWLWIQKSVCFCLWFQSNGNKGEHHHTQIKTYIFNSLKFIEVHKASSPLLHFGGYPLLFLHPNLAPSLNLWHLEYCPCYFISRSSYHLL